MSQSPISSQNQADERVQDPEEAMRAVLEQARREVESFVREQPHAALGLAAACGFVLGGGLTPRRLWRLAFMFGGPLASRELMGQAASWVAQALPGESAT